MTWTDPKGASAFKNQASAGAAPSPSTVPVKRIEADIVNSPDPEPQTRAAPIDRGLKISSESSRTLVNKAQAESLFSSDPRIQIKEAQSSTFTTDARLNWQPSKSDDPFGVRISTNEFASGYPFELANKAKHKNVRDNILYDIGNRDATAYFPHLPDVTIQPLQPGADRTPGPVKARIAANNTRREASKTEIKAAKAEEINIFGVHEIATARGIREQILNDGPTYKDTILAAMKAAGDDPVAQTDGNAAYDFVKHEAITERRATMKAEAMAKEFRPAVIKEEDNTAQGSFTAQSSTYSASDAPTQEQELPREGWALQVAERTLDKAQIQYNMMYQVVTQMQRDRLELGHEVCDCEVICLAHDGYIATEKEEAATLIRAAEVQKIRALATSVKNQLLEAQTKGQTLTRIGHLDLSQHDIAGVLERCKIVGGSAAAANDYINMRAKSEAFLQTDSFVKFTNFDPQDVVPATIKDLIDGARAGIAENKEIADSIAAKQDYGIFETAATKIESDLRAMKAFKSKLGTAPRDFTAEIAEIQQELAELKAHRAAYPGDPDDMVPDSVDDAGYAGIAVRHDDFGDKLEDEDEDADASAAEATDAAPAKKLKLSRAEQRRVARQKAKGKGKGRA